MLQVLNNSLKWNQELKSHRKPGSHFSLNSSSSPFLLCYSFSPMAFPSHLLYPSASSLFLHSSVFILPFTMLQREEAVEDGRSNGLQVHLTSIKGRSLDSNESVSERCPWGKQSFSRTALVWWQTGLIHCGEQYGSWIINLSLYIGEGSNKVG